MTRSLLPRWIRVRLYGDERGFTMVEVMVAILIFGVMMTGIATLQGSTLNLIRNDRHRSVAANLAAQEMDTVRALAQTDFDELANGTSPLVQTQNVGTPPVPYTVTREVTWVEQDAGTGICEVPPQQGERPAYLRVNVSVAWPNMAGVTPIQSQTLVAPPVGTYDAITGHIGVVVRGRDNQPQANVPVSIAGPESASKNTDSDGCAFFAFIAAGDYTVTASTPGYVDFQGVAAPAQAASVIVGNTTSVQFNYDQAAALSLTLVGKGLGALAIVPTDAGAVILSNTHLLPAGAKAFAGTGSSRAISGLFPFAEGYGAWVGDCADANVGAALLIVDPGGTTPADVALPDVRVTVEQLNPDTGLMVPVPGKQVDASHLADAGCASGETFSIGQTDANGQIVFALPVGTWQVSVDGGLLFSGSLALDPTVSPADADGTWPYDILVSSS